MLEAKRFFFVDSWFAYGLVIADSFVISWGWFENNMTLF